MGLLQGLLFLAACGGGGGGGEGGAAPTPPAAPPPAPPVISQPPQVQRVMAGETAVFAIAARGTGTLAYQWLRDGIALEGETRPRLEVLAGAGGATSWYSVRVSDANGSVTSAQVRYELRAPDAWQRWGAAGAGPSLGTIIDNLGQFFNPVFLTGGPDLFIYRNDPPELTSRLVSQGFWEAVVFVNDWVEGVPSAGSSAAGPTRAVVYAADGRLWRVDLRVLPGTEPQARALGTASTRELCAGPSFFQDRVDPMRSLLFFRRPGPDESCGSADDPVLAIRLNQQPFEDGIELAPRAQPVWPLLDAAGVLKGVVALGADGRVLRIDARSLEAETAFVPAERVGQTLVAPTPDQPWWVFNDGARIRSVDVTAPTPWTVRTLIDASAPGEALPLSRGTARIDGALSLLLWGPTEFSPAGGSLTACAVSGCPSGPRELVAASSGYTTSWRVQDLDGGDRPWLTLDDDQLGSLSSTTRLFELRPDGRLVERQALVNVSTGLPLYFENLIGPWVMSTQNGAERFGVPIDRDLPERQLSPGGFFLPYTKAARADRFWFYYDSTGILQLRGAAGELLRELSDVRPIQHLTNTVFYADELIVLRPGVAGSGDGGRLLGLDLLTGEVRTDYGSLPDWGGAPSLQTTVRDGQIVQLVWTRATIPNRTGLLTIRVGTPGLRRVVNVGP